MTDFQKLKKNYLAKKNFIVLEQVKKTKKQRR